MRVISELVAKVNHHDVKVYNLDVFLKLGSHFANPKTPLIVG